MANDELGKRMKENYENRTRYFLPRRTFTIIRIDGKAFHAFTKNFEKPSDSRIHKAFMTSIERFFKEAQGCVFAYQQSDEVSFLLQDFKREETEAWFNGNLQKIASVSSSIFTNEFNNELARIYIEDEFAKEDFDLQDFYDNISQIPNKISAKFDSRVFIIPDTVEVMNYFIWRQKDAIRNSISSLAQSLFSHKELHGKSQEDMKQMCKEKNMNWEILNKEFKYGTLFFQNETGGISQKETQEITNYKDEFIRFLRSFNKTNL